MESKQIDHVVNSNERNNHSERDQMIAVAAYFKAEKRGFLPQYELADWLAAEVEIEGYLSSFQA